MDQPGTTPSIDRLHPLEVKVLNALGEASSRGPLSDEEIVKASGLEPSQLSMAVEWLLTKWLIHVASETVESQVSLTKTGEQFFEKYSPIERILAAVKEASAREARLTIRDIQLRENLEAGDISGAVGSLKKEGVIQIVAGGYVEATGKPSSTAESLRGLLQQLRGTRRALSNFSEPMQQVIRQHAVRRGNSNEPFRIDEQVKRTYALTPEGREAAGLLTQQHASEEISQLTPELLKDGSWRTKRFRKYTISLRAPRVGAG